MPQAAGWAQSDMPGAKPDPHPNRSLLTTPLRDTNIIKTKVPPLLEAVMVHPYALSGTRSCAQIGAQVRALNDVLGQDLDTPATGGKRSDASVLASAAAQDFAGSIIPGEGIIRHISGAYQAQRHYAAAVFAGAIRRSFLKGIGLGRGCKYPAGPRGA